MLHQAQNKVKGWKITVPLVAAICATIYLVGIAPMQDTTKWKEMQRVNRANMDKEAIQPGGMRVWSNPFEKRED